jgi:hypothetical protein
VTSCEEQGTNGYVHTVSRSKVLFFVSEVNYKCSLKLNYKFNIYISDSFIL